jgi:hypothetical protein
VKQKRNRFWLIMGQAVAAVLLFVCLAGVSVAGVAEDLAAGNSLQNVINQSLQLGTTVDDLMKDLIAANVTGKDIICGLFAGGAAKYEVISAALDNGMDKTNVVQWAYQCGASREDIQNGFSKAGETLTPNLIFLLSNLFDESAKEYNYNPPSPSK